VNYHIGGGLKLFTHQQDGSVVGRLGFVAALLSLAGCARVQAINDSATPVTIAVSAATLDDPTTQVDLGTLAVDPRSSVSTTLQPPPYSAFPPGLQYALLRFHSATAGDEEIFLPVGGSVVAKVTTQGYLDLQPLPTPNDEQFRNELLGRLDGLSFAINRGDQFTAAQILLGWVANNTDDALSIDDSEATTPLIVTQPASYCYHEIFRRDRGAVFCGGFAVYMQKVLLLFGIDALVLDFGDLRTGLTHMTVVTPVRQADGIFRFYLFDPKMNLRCVDANLGVPLDFFTVLDRQRLGLFDSVNIVQGSIDDRDWAGTAIHQTSPKYQLHARKGSRYLYRREGYTLKTFVEENAAAFTAGGFRTDEQALFQLAWEEFFSVRTGNNGASRDAFVRELTNRGINLKYPGLE
jgi:hypothetical protein